MITFQQEPVLGNTQGWDEAYPLFLKHQREIDPYNLPLDIDVDAYNRAAEAGTLRYYTARHDGNLIGYGTYFVTRSYRSQILCATQDVFYLIPEYRRGMTGINLLRYMEARLKLEGVRMTQVVIDPTGTLGKLLPKLDYKPTDTVFTKILGD